MRHVIETIRKEGFYRRYDARGVALLRQMEELNIILVMPGARGGRFYILEDAWEKVDLDVAQRQRKAAVRSYPVHELPPIPDPPKVINRPPAVYSNRSQKELIDHVLKNY
jgi:hypothetical protein